MLLPCASKVPPRCLPDAFQAPPIPYSIFKPNNEIELFNKLATFQCAFFSVHRPHKGPNIVSMIKKTAIRQYYSVEGRGPFGGH